jgi:hypothetical protein
MPKLFPYEKPLPFISYQLLKTCGKNSGVLPVILYETFYPGKSGNNYKD